MKLAVLFKFAAFTALCFVLGSCTQTLKDTGCRALQTWGYAGALSEPAATEMLQQSLSAFLEETSQALATNEEQLPLHKASRVRILSELSHLCFILGELGAKQQREKWFQTGRYYAELLSQEQPDRVEGHYWRALNLAGLAEVGGAGRGLRLLPVIVEELQAALALDENYNQAGPHRILGRVRCRAPCWPLSEGDLDDSLQHLRAAVKIAPENSTNHLFLAETLMQLGHDEEAVRELKRVVACRQHALWPHGFEDDHQEALRLMTEYKSGEGRGRRLEKMDSLALPGNVP